MNSSLNFPLVFYLPVCILHVSRACIPFRDDVIVSRLRSVYWRFTAVTVKKVAHATYIQVLLPSVESKST